ncbi:MAG: methionine synthase [Actinobacteria bacterium 13_2_20CM_2_71_6]|nr:MAG: methionine synthase [Actinobacteria bacterium 13_2_20CM_2_71_6]
MTLPWAPGSATGIGSLPGTDIVEALRIVFGELPLPYLPELPARGPGADMVGRTAGLLVELPVDLYAGRWRLASRPGLDARRIADLLERDLDALTAQADGYAGPLKVQAAGPWTLASSLQLPVGGAVLRDPGAVRELVASLAEGLALHVREVGRRVPGASVVLQLDEPSLPSVLAGRVPTESGFGTLRTVPESVARSALQELISAVGVPVVVHCCASPVPVALLREAGAVAVALDLSVAPSLDPLGEAIDAGMGLFAGAVAATGPPPPAVQVAGLVRELWTKLGFPLAELSSRVVVTPACGQAGATPDDARAALVACREAAERLRELG